MSRTHTLTRMALMLALLIALATAPPLTVGFLPVPLVMQNFGVMLAALVLPARPATLTVALLLGLAAIGLPVLSGGRGGLAVVLGPTAGFMLGWCLTPAALALSRRGQPRRGALVPGLVLGAVALPNLLGALWLSVTTGVPLAASLVGVLIYLPGDACKALVAVAVVQPIRRAVKRAV